MTTEQRDWDFVDLGLAALPGLCLVVERQPGGGYGPRVISPPPDSQPPDAVAYAAVWRDHSGRVIEWLELWVQDLSSWQRPGAGVFAELANPALDRHWQKWCESLARTHPPRVLDFGLHRHPVPVIWLESDGRTVHEGASRWALCTDDALLDRHRLDGYTNSRHRYLWNGDTGQPRFLALTDGAPEGPNASRVEEAFTDALPVNPGGSLMALFRSCDLPLADFVDMLGHRAAPGDIGRALRFPSKSSAAKLRECAGGLAGNSGLFFQREPGHLCEVLHLKLALLQGCLVAVERAVRDTGSPFLGLDAGCFAVTLPDPDPALPFLWSGQVALVAPPQCVVTRVGDISEPCILPSPGLPDSIYRSPGVLNQLQGHARVRQRTVSEPDDDGLVIIEGTLISDEPLGKGRLDLLELEWNLPKFRTLRLYARIESKAPHSGDGYRFRTLQSKLPPQILTWLTAQSGSLTSDRVRFHLLPRIGTPRDLYSLGVLALRILLHHPDGLGAVLDDLLTLGQAYRTRRYDTNWSTGTGTLHDFLRTGEGVPAVERLGSRWLVPARDAAGEEPQELPPALWWATLGFVMRLFPETSADSFCKNNEDFQPRAPHEVFAAAIAELETLLIRTRETLFGSPVANREVRQAIQQLRTS